MNNKPKRLLDQVRDHIRIRHLSISTEEAYCGWIRRYILFHEKKHPKDEEERCSYCYHDRLKSTAVIARHGKFDYFTSTLPQSKFQKHDTVRSIGESLGKSYGVPFLYRDFREGLYSCGVQ